MDLTVGLVSPSCLRIPFDQDEAPTHELSKGPGLNSSRMGGAVALTRSTCMHKSHCLFRSKYFSYSLLIPSLHRLNTPKLF